MTTISAPPARPGGDPELAAMSAGEFAPPPKLRRRPVLIAAAVGAICLGALISVWAFTSVSDTHAVLAMRSTVERGQVIERDDLMSVSISVDPALRPLGTDQADQVIGKRAALDMPAGGVVTEAQITDQLIPPAGRSVVGISVAPGLLPADTLQVGAPVRVVSTPGDQGTIGTTPPESINATVVGIATDDVAGTTVLNVEVPYDVAPQVAAQAATGKVAIVADSQER